MDKNEVIEKLKRFAPLVVEMLSPEKIVLYGSYARGNPHEYSDIDVAVIVDEIEGDILNIETQLFKLGRNIDVFIEPVLLEQSHDPSGFLEQILGYGEIIYRKSA
ncbi:MAG: nucleotidyltransferase domain-containing protein [Victivallales bacterium]|nr:nucleotidyltransferase domain-containing protein [Victivallales bacterium]